MANAVQGGVERFTFHDLRAKAASGKGTIEEAAALLGHASSETTKRGPRLENSVQNYLARFNKNNLLSMPIAHLFWTFCAKNFEPTQLLGRMRGSDYEPGGREFESLRARHNSNG
jgi:hypothetical protein